MRRTGFSLVEILIVLALLVIVFALALPPVLTMYRNARPRAAADSVRSALLLGRTHAMEDGRAYRFGYIPGGVAFRVAPDDPAYWTGSGQSSAPPAGGIPPLVRAWNLPGDVRFSAGSGTTQSAPAGGLASSSKEPDPETIDASKFEPLVVFFSDGTAEQDVEIAFDFSGTAPLVLSLRGLTGVSTVRTEVRQGGGSR